MRTSTKNLIIVIILLVAAVAVLSVLSGVDLELNGNILGKEPLGVCEHTAHDKNGVCKNCGETVGHDHSVLSGNYTSLGNGKHSTSYYCSVSCGSYEVVVKNCNYVNGVCYECGYNTNLAQSCTHAAHDSSGICISCGTNIGHNESIVYIYNGDNTHTVSYDCVGRCGYGGVSEPIGCIFSQGKCIDCGGMACNHTEHGTDGNCIACGYYIGHDYDYHYESISGDDLYHNYTASCDVCDKEISGKGTHFYNGDYTCDKCGHTYVE